jgi:Domain of unknown function (DUF6457)
VTVLDDWINAACADLGIDRALLDERLVLDLARVAAHQVDRPAAPVTAFLLGVAVGRGDPLAPTAARLSELAAAWPSDSPAS